MDIIFATNNSFCQHAAVAILSLLDNNKNHDITLHLFCIDIKADNLNQIKSLIAPTKVGLKTYQIDRELFQGFPNPGNYSYATYLRLLTASILPDIDKVLYLDCDLVVNGDISELWNIDISDYAAAGVYDTVLSYNIIRDYIGYDFIKEGYFNAGVLLMNLKYFRENRIEKKFFDYLTNHDAKLNDQDAINAVLHGKIKVVHPKWNCHVGYFAFPPLVINEQKKYIKKLWRNAVIIHFTGPAKPWCLECVNPYRKKYLEYLKLTPWKNYKLCRIEENYFKSYKKIFLRHLKNVVAYVVSNCYR